MLIETRNSLVIQAMTEGNQVIIYDHFNNPVVVVLQGPDGEIHIIPANEPNFAEVLGNFGISLAPRALPLPPKKMGIRI